MVERPTNEDAVAEEDEDAATVRVHSLFELGVAAAAAPRRQNQSKSHPFQSTVGIIIGDALCAQEWALDDGRNRAKSGRGRYDFTTCSNR